jgi:hypothetical protein
MQIGEERALRLIKKSGEWIACFYESVCPFLSREVDMKITLP